MKYTEKLIAFMKNKASFCEDYFCEEDEYDLRNLPENEAKKIWLKIKDAIFKRNDFGLSASTCPFCYLFDCSDCPYGLRHDELGCRTELLTNEWYRKTINKIEKEGGEHD